MTLESKSIRQYETLLQGYRMMRLKKIKRVVEFLHNMSDFHDLRNNVLTVQQADLQAVGLSLDGVKDIYYYLCDKTFEVLPVPDRADPVYPVGILPNPYPGKSTANDKITMSWCMDIQFFPVHDPRHDNLGHFEVALYDKISGVANPATMSDIDRRSEEIKRPLEAFGAPLKIKVKNGLLIINRDTGEVKLNKHTTCLNQKGDAFRLLVELATDNNHVVTYDDFFDNNTTKIRQRNLAFVVRDIKKSLGILPKKGTANKDIIENIKNYGYKLII